MTAVNENALCVTRDGEIFLGGTQGMISFHEMELNFTPKPYKIILSRLIVNGTEIQVEMRPVSCSKPCTAPPRLRSTLTSPCSA